MNPGYDTWASGIGFGKHKQLTGSKTLFITSQTKNLQQHHNPGIVATTPQQMGTERTCGVQSCSGRSEYYHVLHIYDNFSCAFQANYHVYPK
jgi:hypothetical protein